ncbi:MAG TPA: hypothetical protein VFI73_11075 [Candidatus Nitrosopolaris sp.]|nr:hypothetical protein [Candidatus Nitrosopolaris sp.]
MNSDSFKFGRYKGADELNDNKRAEMRSCWSVLSINGIGIEAKIIHKRGGKFIILEDNYMGKYIGKIVDASDVIRCKL